MKRNTYGALTMLALAFLISIPMAQAQTRLQADVPFAFSLGQSAMSAGEYEINSAGQDLLLIRNSGANEAQLLVKSQYVQGRDAGRPRLVFHKYGDQYFLSQIWDGNSNIGVELPVSHREKEIKMAGAAFPRGAQTVIVAMK